MRNMLFLLTITLCHTVAQGEMVDSLQASLDRLQIEKLEKEETLEMQKVILDCSKRIRLVDRSGGYLGTHYSPTDEYRIRLWIGRLHDVKMG